MKYIIMLLLIAVSYVLMQSVYSITDTALGNTGLNVKPIHKDYFEQVKDIVEGMDNGSLYRNNPDVVDAIRIYGKYSNRALANYFSDIIYTLYTKKKLTDTTAIYSKDPKSYHEIPDTELKYYIGKLGSIKDMDVTNDELSARIKQIMKEDLKTQTTKAIEHFVTILQDYLVQQHILQLKQPASKATVADKVNDVTNDIKNTEPAQTLTNAHTDVEDSVTKLPASTDSAVAANTDSTVAASTDSAVAASTDSAVADAVDASMTNTAVDSADAANALDTKLNRFMSRLKATKYKIPIAVLSTVLGIGTIGGVYYATGSTDALDTMGSDTDTEVLNDTNDTAQRHGVCIATITACTVLLALCTTTAYWIVCKQKQHTTHSNASDLTKYYDNKLLI